MVESYLNATLQFTNRLLKSVINGLLVLNQEGLVSSASQEAASVVGCELETLIEQDYVQMIESSAQRCANIVTVLGNYTVNDTLQMTVTDLNMVIEERVAMVHDQFRSESNVEVELDLCQVPRSIVCDHNRITQVAVNLLANARDALPPSGGSIRIRSWPLDGSQGDPTRTEGEANLLAFSVADTGDGILPEVIDGIFDPFFTTKPSGSSAGLGLYIAKRIASQHRGRILAENKPDIGTTFTAVLPQQQQGLTRE